MKPTHSHQVLTAVLLGAAISTAAIAAPRPEATGGGSDDSAELTKKLQNPIASLISIPIQSNWDFGIGAANAMKYTANIQPVIPFSISRDWNIISRTILPVVYAESQTVGGRNKFGLGDTSQSFFFPAKEADKRRFDLGRRPSAAHSDLHG